MFVNQSKKGAVVFNALILVALVAVAVVGVMTMLKFKPVGTGGEFKATLDLKKK